MTTGWKSILLKPVDPFFSKDGVGTEIPIRITGTESEPHFGLDFGHKGEQENIGKSSNHRVEARIVWRSVVRKAQEGMRPRMGRAVAQFPVALVERYGWPVATAPVMMISGSSAEREELPMSDKSTTGEKPSTTLPATVGKDHQVSIAEDT